MLVNGATQTVAEVLANPALAGLLSDEGVVPNPRYPTNALPALPGTTNAPGFTGWTDRPEFHERIAAFTLDPEVKVHINAPAPDCLHARARRCC